MKSFRYVKEFIFSYNIRIGYNYITPNKLEENKKWLVDFFDEGRKYVEQEVNEIIGQHHPDFSTLRRELIDQKLMQRERGVYWRIPWKMPELGD